MGIEDIWDKKPPAYQMAKWQEGDWYYGKEKMDAFHENLKAHHTSIEENAEKWDEAQRINVKVGNGKPISCVDMAKKLEAVKEWVEKHGDSVGMYQANWDELDKILGG